MFKDYYKILDIETTKVSLEEIKNAYRLQAKKFHPDINSESTEEIIKDINEAYKVLSDIDTKKKYDRLWTNYVVRNKLENKTYEQRMSKETLKEELANIFFGGIFEKNRKRK